MRRIVVGVAVLLIAPLGLVCSIPLLFAAAGGAAASSSLVVAGHGDDLQVVPAGGPSCDSAVGCQPLPAQLPYVPPGFYPDPYKKPPGECTSWAAALWPGHHGAGVTWGGDAWEWAANAAKQGYATSSSPSVGAVVVFGRTASHGGEFGHVAIVLVVGQGAFRMTEMNVSDTFVVDERTVDLPDRDILGYIPVPADAFVAAVVDGT